MTPKSKVTNWLKNYTTFYTLIENEYHNSGTKTHHSASRKPWWRPALDSARKKLRIIQEAWMREQYREEKLSLWEKFKKEQRNFNHSAHKAKRQYLKERQIHLLMTEAKTLKKFWKEFDSIGISNDINNTALPDYIQKEDGTHDHQYQYWRAHFNTLLTPQETVDSEPCCISTLPSTIYKGKGNKHDPSNYRGITLQSCIAKAFAKVINNKLGNCLESTVNS